MILKRALLCGGVWCLGSLQYLSEPGMPKPLFLVTFLVGLAICVLSLQYQGKKNTALKVLLAVQAVYYLAALGYCIMVVTELTMKLFGCLSVAVMLSIIVSTLVTLTKQQYPAYH